jgi:OFA family oxalate/formate antiporter-like MFS transporter
MAETNQNRWMIVLGGSLMNFCIGVVYIWSIFLKPLQEMFGWSTSEASLAYTISLGMLPVMMIVGGYLTPKLGIRKVAILGSAMMFIGFFIASKSSSLTMLYIGYGFFAGGGAGVAYGIPLSTVLKWFPDKRGMVAGLVIGSLGFGSFFFSKLGYNIMLSYGPLTTLAIMGVIVFIGVALGALLLKAAPDGYVPPGWTPPTSATAKAATNTYNFTPNEMLRTPQYYMLFAIYSGIMISSLMIIGHASPIAQKVAGLTPLQASTIVGLLGIFNSAGRILWGAISDKLGRIRSVVCMLLATAIAMFLMNSLTSFWGFAIGVSVVAICFGGSTSVIPAITTDSFGAKYVGINYGFVLLAYSAGAIIGPMMAAKVLEMTGGIYSTAFIISGALCVVSMVLALLYKTPKPPVIQGEQEAKTV